MTPVQAIQTAITNYATQLATISANPQPSYSVQGVSMTLTEYQKFLAEQIKALQEVLVMLSGPYQLVTQGIS